MSGLFGGGGSDNSALMWQIAQQQAQLKSEQGTQLALLSKNQAANDNETASLSKPGLGRALLSYSGRDQRAQTLGG